MADPVLVQIKIPTLLENVRKADSLRVWTEVAVKDSLASEGFIEKPDGWLCEEISLRLLDRSEYS